MRFETCFPIKKSNKQTSFENNIPVFVSFETYFIKKIYIRSTELIYKKFIWNFAYLWYFHVKKYGAKNIFIWSTTSWRRVNKNITIFHMKHIYLKCFQLKTIEFKHRLCVTWKKTKWKKFHIKHIPACHRHVFHMK